MRYVIVVILAVIGQAMSAVPAFAHRPYYTQVEKIRLPTGETGEVRLLNGDGIVATDPVRPLIVDSQGRLLARGRKAYSIAVSCAEDRTCLIVDLGAKSVYELDSGSFRQGPTQPAVRPFDRTDDWDLERGNESWGFSLRDASADEILQANGTLAYHRLRGLVVVAVLAGLSAYCLLPFRVKIRFRQTRWVVWTGLSLVGLMKSVLLFALTFWVSILAAFPLELWLTSMTAGAAVVLVLAWIIWRYSSTRPGAAV